MRKRRTFGKGSGKREFSRGGRIETARCRGGVRQPERRQVLVCRMADGLLPHPPAVFKTNRMVYRSLFLCYSVGVFRSLTSQGVMSFEKLRFIVCRNVVGMPG